MTSVPCWWCGRTASRYCRLEGAVYWRCTGCESVFLHPRPTPDQMRAYAERQYRQDGFYAEYVRARELKVATFERRLARIRAHVPAGKLLDLGCACGFMIEAALAAGYDASGVEFSRDAIQAAAPEIRPRIVAGDVDAVPPGAYDVVTAFDILEHTQDPLAALVRWAGLLRPGGVLVVATPDTDSSLRRLMGRRWPMLQPFQHTYLLSGRHVPKLLAAAGLQTLEVRSAEKVMTLGYLLRQLELYFPRLARLAGRIAGLVPGAARRPVPFRIGEFLAIARKPEGGSSPTSDPDSTRPIRPTPPPARL